MFEVNGAVYSLATMLATNADDAEFCAWLLTASAGDVFADGEVCICVGAA